MIMESRAYYDLQMEKLGRRMLIEVYDKLTNTEREKFKLIFKTNANKVKTEEIKNAYSICARTVNKRQEAADG